MKYLVFVALLAAVQAQTNTRFFTYTRSNPTTMIEVFNGDLGTSFLDPAKPTHVITHGFTDSGNSQWIIDSKDAFLRVGDFNIIVVDWPGLYNVIQENGLTVAAFYQYMQDVGYDLGTFHCSGHSLGGHLCGFSGKFLEAGYGPLGRITGIDASGPEFFIDDPTTRLADTDAVMVDCIHTDGGGSGFLEPLGKIDFFPNGGSADQPGCGLIGGICSHVRAQDLFIESIESRGFHGRLCDSWDNYQFGVCNGNEEISMGPIHMPLTATLGSYYLVTRGESPFAIGAP